MNIDYEAIAEYLTLGYTLNWKTFEKGRTFKPKHVDIPQLKLSPQISIEDVKRALEEYFMKFNGKKVAVSLSGGKDSRLILEMCNYLDLDTTAITFGYKKDSRENIIANKVSSALNIPHIFLELKPEIYSLENIRETLEVYKYDPSSAPSEVHYYYKDILSEFDVFFKGDALTFAPREERFYQPKDKIKRLIRSTTFDNIVKPSTREKIKLQIIENNKDKNINEIFLNQLKNFRFRRFDVTKEIINIEIPGINEKVLNTMWSLPEKGLVKKIMKKYNFKTYNLPCTRSPFPLWFPWIIHYGYKYLKNFMLSIDATMISNLDMGIWSNYWHIYCRLMTDLAKKLSLPQSLHLDFLDSAIVEKKLKYAEEHVDYAKSLWKLIKLKIWFEEIT